MLSDPLAKPYAIDVKWFAVTGNHSRDKCGLDLTTYSHVPTQQNLNKKECMDLLRTIGQYMDIKKSLKPST
jgi:hypothetical protein